MITLTREKDIYDLTQYWAYHVTVQTSMQDAPIDIIMVSGLLAINDHFLMGFKVRFTGKNSCLVLGV